MSKLRVKFMREKTIMEFFKKTIILLIAEFLFAISLGLLSKLSMGQSPSGVMAVGLTQTFGVSTGMVFTAFGLILVTFLLIFDRRHLYVGSLIDVLSFGIIYDLTYHFVIDRIPNELSLISLLILPIVAVFILSFAVAVYVPINFGVNVYDGVAIFLNGKLRVGFAVSYFLINTLLIVIGLIFGAKFITDIGYGTVLMIVISGVIIDFIIMPVEAGVRKIFALPKN